MKFLLELVSCCGCHESERPSEESMLVPVVQRRRRGRMAGVVVGGGEWKPSLYAIAEDNVVIERQVSDSDKVVKRKNLKRVRSFNRDFRQSSMSTFIPAFSPTPFMF